MALKLRRRVGVFTNGILPHRISGRPLDLLRTGADSFKRVLGSALVDPCGIRREPGQRNHSKAQGTIRRSLSIVARRPTINDTVSAVAHYLKDPLRPIVAEGTVRPHGPVARL